MLKVFHSWPESQSASLPKSGVRPPWRVENADPLFHQAGVRGLKVLPPYGAWVTEAMERLASSLGYAITYPVLLAGIT